MILERSISMTSAVAALISVPIAPAESDQAETPRVYRLRKSFASVRFEPSGKGRIVFLPEGADLRLVGPSRLCKCLEVVCDNQTYNIFEVDLLGPWSNPVRSSRRGIARVKAIEACA